MRINSITNYNLPNRNVSRNNTPKKQPSFSAIFFNWGLKSTTYTGMTELKEILKDELPNILIDSDSEIVNRHIDKEPFEKGGYPLQKFKIGYYDGLKAREDILKQQEKYQTIPSPILNAYKNYDPALVDRVGGGYVKLDIGCYVDRETPEDFAQRCACKIREIAKNLPELFLTRKISVTKDGKIITHESKNSCMYSECSHDVEYDRIFEVPYQKYTPVKPYTDNIPIG